MLANIMTESLLLLVLEMIQQKETLRTQILFVEWVFFA
jgi:hypothetical protein